ncbi:MAG: hypothetical protein KIT80_09135 [Chitinophagaceae bacterium]|nr:hypothetical protein [Chitinophagaceae bacterium]MCW5927061.1 hypothetical protein [Chitinophagaceae bacterium]
MRLRSFNKLVFIISILVACGGIIEACREPVNEQARITRKKEADLGKIAALPVSFLSPADNPTTEEKVELGRLLFYDPILSGNKDVSCATCHHPEFGYAESLDLPIGVNGRGLGQNRVFKKPNNIPFTKRNSQSLLNIAFNGIDENGNYVPDKAPMFWDLRASGLEEQALEPIKTLEEMRGFDFAEHEIVPEVVKRLNAIPAYGKIFNSVFPGDKEITAENLAKSLAAFQRSLVSNNSRFDQYMRGDKSALSTREIEGMQLFITSGCARCHNGPMFSDFKPHVLGVAENDKLPFSDSGFQQSYAFRTPTLRNLRRTRPYMHNGKIQTLESVLTFYEDLQGKELANKHLTRQHLDTLAKQLRVEFKHINTIVEFLNTLNDDDYDRRIPDKVPSGLPVGGLIKN